MSLFNLGHSMIQWYYFASISNVAEIFLPLLTYSGKWGLITVSIFVLDECCVLWAKVMSHLQYSVRSTEGPWIPQLPKNLCRVRGRSISSDLFWSLSAQCHEVLPQLLEQPHFHPTGKSVARRKQNCSRCSAEQMVAAQGCPWEGSVGRSSRGTRRARNGRHVCSGRQHSQSSQLSPLSIVWNKRWCCIWM